MTLAEASPAPGGIWCALRLSWLFCVHEVLVVRSRLGFATSGAGSAAQAGAAAFFFRAVVNMSVGALGLPGQTSGPHMANVSCVLSAACVSLAPEGYQQGTGAFACVGFLGLHHVGR